MMPFVPLWRCLTIELSLPVSQSALLERLAENPHEVWAVQRINVGWTYDLQRDDVAKKHPCLVPYTELTESEKEYDRKSKTAAETLKAILLPGYSIHEPQG
ncbi:MAG: RyR domain-containing protein [Gemmataceae bacterium]